MIHTVYIDDSSTKGKEILRNLRKEKSVVSFDKPMIETKIAEGYMTSSSFRAEVKQGLADKLKADGRL
jgi:hypothetical protein